MDDLIRELEQAQEGSRWLDALVFCAVLHPGKKPERNFFYTNREEWGVFVTNQPQPGTTFHDAPHYTTNLQDALVLVPEGMYIKLERYTDGWYADLRKTRGSSISYLGSQKPPALALTIAALKARREME